MSGGVGGIGGGGRIEPDADLEVDGGICANEAPAEAEAPVSRAPTSGDWAARIAGTPARADEAEVQGQAQAQAQARRAESMPVVHFASKGEAVKELQERLNDFREKIGLKPIPVNGSFGAKTEEAVKQFQKLGGLDADGAVGPKTWRRLLGEANPKPADAPKPGSTTAKVLEHRDVILAASQKYGIPPAIIAGMIEMESGGRADVVGITGDKGLLQINDKAHPEFFKKNDWKDASASATYGVGLLVDGLKAFSGDVDKALASYNAGVGGVRGGLRNGKTLDDITYKPHYVSNIERFSRKYEDYF